MSHGGEIFELKGCSAWAHARSFLKWLKDLDADMTQRCKIHLVGLSDEWVDS